MRYLGDGGKWLVDERGEVVAADPLFEAQQQGHVAGSETVPAALVDLPHFPPQRHVDLQHFQPVLLEQAEVEFAVVAAALEFVVEGLGVGAVGEEVGEGGRGGGGVEEGGEAGFLGEVLVDVLLDEGRREDVLRVEQLGVDVLEVLALDVDGLGVAAAREGEVHVEVVLVNYADVREPFGFLQKDRRVQVFNNRMTVDCECHSGVDVDDLVGVDIDCVEDLLLHGEHVEVAQRLQMPAVVGGGVGELGEDGDEQGSDGHVLAVEGVVAVPQEDEPDRHVDGHAEPVVEDLAVLELLPDHPDQFQTLHVAAPRHHHCQPQQGSADQREQLVLVDRVLVQRVVGELALCYLHRPQVLDVVADHLHHVLVASACEAQCHRQEGASYYREVDRCDGLIIDF